MGLWGTIAGIGASLIPGVGPVLGPIVGAAVNGVEQSNAAKQASQAQVAAGNQALNLYQGIYNQQRSDLSPYRNAGTSALGAEMGLLGFGPGAMGPTGGDGSAVGTSSGVAGGPSLGPLGADGLPSGAISDPSKNGGFAGQVPGTATLGAPGSMADNTSSYGPKTSQIPNMKFQHSDGTVYVIPANEVANAEKQDPTGKVLGPA